MTLKLACMFPVLPDGSFKGAFRLAAVLLFAWALSACSSLPHLYTSDETTRIEREKIEFGEILWFAQRAKAAYLDEQDIKKIYPLTTRIKTPKGTGVQYFLEVIPKQKVQIIAIRGSDNLANILEDIAYEKTVDNLLGFFLHRGIHNIALKIYADVKPHLNRKYKIKTTGHSLGAAVGVVLMMYLHRDGYSVSKSVNFGQPKVISAAGAKRFEWLPIVRVINENDAIPMLPPLTIINPIHGIYEHVGSEIILLEKDRYVFLDKHAAMRISVGEFWRNIRNVSLGDHSMDRYIRKLMKMDSNATQVSYANREAYTN